MTVATSVCLVRPRFVSFQSLRLKALHLVAKTALLSLAASAICVPLAAQTAHFLYSQSLVPATGLQSADGLAVDTSGNVYIADPNAGKILKETVSNGTYTQQVILTGLSDPESLAVDATGNVYFATGSQTISGSAAVYKATLSNGTYTSSLVTSQFGSNVQLAGIALDKNGNLYLADKGDGRVLKLSSGGSTPTVILAQNPSSDPNALVPVAITVDATGNVYFINKTGEFEKLVPGSGGTYTASVLTSIGTPTGSATSSAWLAVAANGDLYIANQLASDLVKATLNPDGTYTTSRFANLPQGNPMGIAVDANGTVYLAEANYKLIYAFATRINFGNVPVATTSATPSLSFIFDTAGTLGTIPYKVLTQGASSLDFKAASTQPSTACVSGTAYSVGSICTIDVTFTPGFNGPRYGAAALSNSSGVAIATAFLQGTGTGPQVIFDPLTQSQPLGAGFTAPQGAAVDSSGNVYITDTAVTEVPSGCTSSSCVVTLGGGFVTPGGVAVDGAGNVYVGDRGAGAVKMMPPGCASSACVTTIGGGFTAPGGVAVDGAGTVYVADYTAGQVKSFPAGCAAASCVVTLGGGFPTPSGIALDSSGFVYVVTQGANVYRLAATCTSSACVTTLGGSFTSADGVAVDGTGILYVTDGAKQTVSKMTPGCTSSACVTTLASGFALPSGVSVDASDNVYAVDTGAPAVFELDRADPPTLAFPATAVGAKSTAQTVTVTNIGTSMLSFPAPNSGNNPSISSGFTLDSSGTSACPLTAFNSAQAGVLGAGTSCTLLITFAPTATGTITGSLVLTDNDLNASPSVTQTIGLKLAPSFEVSGLVDSTAGTAQTITVTALDGSGKTLTGYTGTVTFTSSDAQAVLPMDYTFAQADNGVHTFMTGVTLKTSGEQSVTLTDTAIKTTTGSESAMISSASATHIAVTVPSAVTTHTQFIASFKGFDAYGNASTSYAGTANITSSDSAAGSLGSVTFAAGVATANLTLVTVGTQSIAVIDQQNNSVSGTASTTVQTGPVTGLTVVAPSTANVGAPFNFSVIASDAYANTVTSYTGPIHFTSSDSSAVLPANSSLVAGVGAFSATLKTAGNQTITATDVSSASLKGTSGTITVLLPYLVVTTPSDDAGDATQCTIQTAAGAGTDSSCSLRDALLYAAQLGGANIVFSTTTFATAQTITLSNGTLVVPNATSVQGPVSGLTNLVTVDGNKSYTVFTVNSGSNNTALNNLIIKNGSGDQNGSGYQSDFFNLTPKQVGGGIFNEGSLTVTGSIISDSTATEGGGIFSDTASLTVTNTLITSNTATIGGGGIFSLGNNLTVTGSLISKNTALGDCATPISNLIVSLLSLQPNCGGGGILATNTVIVISGTTISGNTASTLSSSASTSGGPTSATYGGGIYSDYNILTITGSTISGNSVQIGAAQKGYGLGGGIACQSYTSGFGLPPLHVLQNTTVANNSIQVGSTKYGLAFGGGVFMDFTDFLSEGVTFTGNSAQVSTATSNHGYGGGVASTDGSDVPFENSILAGNTSSTGDADYSSTTDLSTFSNNGYNNGYTGPEGNQIGTSTTGDSNLSMNLGVLGAYGGTTQTMLPLPNSPAICAGTVENASGQSTDQRGAPRSVIYGGTTCVDSGAVQTNYQLAFYQQPSNVITNTVMTPAPEVALTESGQAFVTSVTIPLTLTGPGKLSSGNASTSSENTFTYSNLSIDTTGVGDTLTATLSLNGSTSATAVSSSFNVSTNVTQLAYGTPPAVSIMPGGDVGSAVTVQEEIPDGTIYATGNDVITLTVTGPGGYSESYTATAVNGVATFDQSTYMLTLAGNYTYTASLTGATSAVATTTVAVIDFSMTGSTTYQTVEPGFAASYAFTVAPTGAGFPGIITFSVTGLPAGATATFTPSSVAMGASATKVTMTVNTTTTAENFISVPWSLALLLLPLLGVGSVRRSSRRLRRTLLLAVFLVAGSVGLLGLTGCIGGGFLSKPPANYVVTITANGGNVTHSITATLNLQ